MSDKKKEVLSFRKSIPAGTTMTIEKVIYEDCTIEEVRIKFYEVQERKLLVRPYVEHKGEKIEDIVDYVGGTEMYVTGNDEYLTFPITIPLETYDKIKIWVSNINDTTDLTLSADVVVDYYAGTQRVVGGVL